MPYLDPFHDHGKDYLHSKKGLVIQQEKKRINHTARENKGLMIQQMKYFPYSRGLTSAIEIGFELD